MASLSGWGAGLLRVRRVRLVLVLMAALALAGLLVQRYLLVHAVAAIQPAPRALRVVVKGAGELVAREQAEVASQASLTVDAVLVDVGSEVRRGQVLVRLDSDEAAAQVRVAEAAEQAARQAVDLARVAHGRAVVLQRRSEADAQRAITLAARGSDAISASELDASLSAASASELDTRGSQLEIEAATQAHAEAQANLELARARLHDTTLRAPFDGLITGRHCSAGDTSSPGLPCLTLVDPASLRVQARFDESALALVRSGDQAAVMLKSQPQAPLEGRVERINRTVDIDTREFSVDVQLGQLPRAWALGERATVEVRARERLASRVIPLSHLVSHGGSRGVWIARDGHAQWGALKLGADDGHQVEVLEGLAADEPVLRPSGMRPGLRVRAELQPW